MIKEWDKFHADFKKLKSTADRYTDRVAEGYIKQMIQTKALCDTGEVALSSAADEARTAGVAGKGLADFLKFKGFADVKKKVDAVVTGLADDIKDLSDFCREAQKVSDQIVVLHKALEKDLNSRKSEKDGRKETEALLDKVDDEYQRLMKVVSFRNRPSRALLGYPETFARTVTRILSDAPEVTKDKGDLPEALELKVLKDKAIRAMTGSNKVIRACDLAVDAVPQGKAAAIAEMKPAKIELDKLKDLDRDYRLVASRHHKDIAASGDRSKIEKLIASIATSLLEAERAVAVALVKINKAV